MASDCRRREVYLFLLMHCLDVYGDAVLELVEIPQIMERNCSLAKKKWMHFLLITAKGQAASQWCVNQRTLPLRTYTTTQP